MNAKTPTAAQIRDAAAIIGCSVEELTEAIKNPAPPPLTDGQRLARIRRIIEDVDNRALAADGPVTPTLEEMTQAEISSIFALACGKDEDWRP